MLTYEEIKKLNRSEITKKIAELKKEYFEKKQKLLRGEHKDISEFKKIKRTVARLLTMAGTLPAEAKVVAEKKETAPTAVETEKKEKKAKKAAAPKAEKKPLKKAKKVKKEEKSK